MNKLAVNIAASFVIVFISCTVFSSLSPSVSYAMPNEPEYAKWGRQAMQIAKEKYPNAQIADYLHIGKITKGEVAEQQFKLWLKEAGQEFGLIIGIEYNIKTEKVTNITVNRVNN